MLSKKSMGLHWYILLIALFVSLGILYHSIATVDIPKVGEFSLNTIKTLEKNMILPTVIEEVMKLINERTPEELKANKIFTLRSYCESGDYKERVRYERQLLIGGFGHLEGNNSFCVIDEDDLTHYFEMIFEGEYDEFRSEDFGEELPISETVYTSSVEKEIDEYTNTVNTSNGLELPVSIERNREEKQIGKIIMKPVFKFPVGYDFDDENNEVCILSVACTANCDDVIKRYDGTIDIEIKFRKKSQNCNDYFFCTNAFPDDFGLKYPCEANFCMEAGVASCSNIANPDTVCPDCCCTPWATGCGIAGCPETMMGYKRECRLDNCDIETKCEPHPCCRDPVCCEQYPPACDCGDNVCCTPDPSLCIPPPEPEPEPEESPPADEPPADEPPADEPPADENPCAYCGGDYMCLLACMGAT